LELLLSSDAKTLIAHAALTAANQALALMIIALVFAASE
tara:strand:+ start:207 stop:323 length:117 start_codon:yes stop_codon:yes gene_type:complete